VWACGGVRKKRAFPKKKKKKTKKGFVQRSQKNKKKEFEKIFFFGVLTYLFLESKHQVGGFSSNRSKGPGGITEAATVVIRGIVLEKRRVWGFVFWKRN